MRTGKAVYSKPFARNRTFWELGTENGNALHRSVGEQEQLFSQWAEERFAKGLGMEKIWEENYSSETTPNNLDVAKNENK